MGFNSFTNRMGVISYAFGDHPSNSTEDRQETLHIILEGELTNFIIITSQGKQETSFNNNILGARSWDGRALLRKRIVAN